MPGVRGGGDCRSLDIRADAELQAFATALDARVLAEGAKLGLKESGFKPLLKESKSGSYAPTFRQKITISEETGRSAAGASFLTRPSAGSPTRKCGTSPGETSSSAVSRGFPAYM